jgi:hypothetical protein
MFCFVDSLNTPFNHAAIDIIFVFAFACKVSTLCFCTKDDYIKLTKLANSMESRCDKGLFDRSMYHGG